MSEGKKIVVEHYPADRLPEDLKRAVGGAGSVRITLERDTLGQNSEPLAVAGLLGAGKGCYAEEKVVSTIRALRDE